MLAIAGGKGGCGKTTTALGLAAALARQGVDPIVADADRDMPDLHLSAGVSSDPDLSGLAGGRSVAAVSHDSPEFPGVSVVPAPSGALSDSQVHAALQRLVEGNDPVLVDCPAGAGPDAVVALRAADEALLVSTLHPSSLRDTAKTAAMATRLDVPTVGVVLTCASDWTMCVASASNPGYCEEHSIRPAISRRVEQLLDVPVAGTVPLVPGFGRDVLAHPIVESAYDRLSATFLEGEHLTFRRKITGY